MGDSDERTSLLFESSSTTSESELKVQPQNTGIQRKSRGVTSPHNYCTIACENHNGNESNPEELPIISTDTTASQSSFVTIFSLWNTMMGTSLLTMPWAISQAGFTCSIFLMIFVGGLSFYTTKLIVNFASGYTSKQRETLEFSDICRTYLGRFGDWTAFAFSLCAIFGALIVYYVLMSNFLYNTGRFIHDKANPTNLTYGSDSTYCASNVTSKANESDVEFYKYWDKQKTVPFFLIIIIFPLMNIKSPTFFTKFNALGTFCVIYVTAFTIYKSVHWGMNVDFSDSKSSQYVAQIELSFPALSGTLTLAFFIHNCVLSITRYQKYPENNDRDILIAYVLVTLTYSLVGFVFYLAYPKDKPSCIDEILLANFSPTDEMAFSVRLVFLFQLITVLPLLVYIIRIQIMNFFFKMSYPSFLHVFVLNIFLTIMCILFACLYPHVGSIIRFTGALCGLTYVYALPPLIYLIQKKRDRKSSRISSLLHYSIIAIGILNFVGQLIISV